MEKHSDFWHKVHKGNEYDIFFTELKEDNCGNSVKNTQSIESSKESGTRCLRMIALCH